MRVFKYPVSASDYMTVNLPAGAKPLHFDMQDGQLCLWALVDHLAPQAPFAFRMAGTGQNVESGGRYINTLLLQDGRLVFHFFAMGN